MCQQVSRISEQKAPSNFSSYLWTCVIVSSLSTSGLNKPDFLGINLLIRHCFLLSENESVPQMILMHFMLMHFVNPEGICVRIRKQMLEIPANCAFLNVTYE
ncbi:hypothetical protein CHARACLAT_032836 [Characodon lateralis]|uniref:Uncharacterized protein n=1 Tax=Characodon lateralis TaxID=208331 RepID=A0ABU7CT87_9TELE|nr:hypothetical protein [Characodon lateralis]